MRTRRDKQIRYAREQSKKHQERWVVEEVTGGHGKGRIQSKPYYREGFGWWPSSVVKTIAIYESGERVNAPVNS